MYKSLFTSIFIEIENGRVGDAKKADEDPHSN